MAMTKAALEELAAERGVDISAAKNNAEREAALEAAGVLKDGEVVPAAPEAGAAGGTEPEASGGEPSTAPTAAPGAEPESGVARRCRGGCGWKGDPGESSVCPSCGEEIA